MSKANILLRTALAAALTFSMPAALFAQSAAPEKMEKSDKKKSKSEAKSTETKSTETKSDAKTDTKSEAKSDTKAAKPLTAQQQKMKDCGAKWQEEKKAKGVSGKAAYQKFLSGCLKA